MSQLKRRKEVTIWNASQSIPFMCIGKKIPLLSREPSSPPTPPIFDANNYSITLPMMRLFALDVYHRSRPNNIIGIIGNRKYMKRQN
jgi:hypothetical protein